MTFGPDFGIDGPTNRVRVHVLAYASKVALIPDDVIVVPALPHRGAGRGTQQIDLTATPGLEGRDDVTEGS
jgi:hypothetical protein